MSGNELVVLSFVSFVLGAWLIEQDGTIGLLGFPLLLGGIPGAIAAYEIAAGIAILWLVLHSLAGAKR